MTRLLSRLFALAGLSLASGLASAHPGHAPLSLMAGLDHPLGLDHLLAMAAVGVWSTVALRGRAQWAGPLTFIAALTSGAALGVAGVTLPGMEALIALSVVAFGAMLLLARQVPAGIGLALVAGSALMHGLAHGAEIPAGASFAGYAAGFMLTTAALHLGGLGLGRAVQRTSATAQQWAWRSAAAGLGGAGLWLLSRV